MAVAMGLGGIGGGPAAPLDDDSDALRCDGCRAVPGDKRAGISAVGSGTHGATERDLPSAPREGERLVGAAV